MQNTVDFDRLKSSNGLLQKWSARFGIDKYDFLRFCFKLRGETEQRKASLPRNFRPQFSKDCKRMFYAAEIESHLISQYTPMVHSIIRRLGVDPDQYDELITEGLMAVRCAVWHYRSHKKKANFTTFCHSSITKRIKWYRSKAYRKTSRRNSKCRIMLSVDLPKELDFSGVQRTCEDNHDDVFSAAVIGRLIDACNLSDQDRFLIESYIGRQDSDVCWYSGYNQRYTSKTRQGIHYQLGRIQSKLLRVMRRSDLIPEGYVPPSRIRQ